MSKPGERVGAISHSDSKKVYLFGFGVYEGNFVPGKNASGFGKILREGNIENPKIVLDSGKIVWGCECWWGPESAVLEKIKDLEIVDVDIDESRKNN